MIFNKSSTILHNSVHFWDTRSFHPNGNTTAMRMCGAVRMHYLHGPLKRMLQLKNVIKIFVEQNRDVFDF